MSSNNQVVIIERRKGYYIYINNCVDNDFIASKSNFLYKTDNLKEAIKWAESYCNEYPYVEYGYRVVLEEKEK